MSRLSEISFEPLEPYDGKLSCTVLRGERGSNAPDLPDITASRSWLNHSYRHLLGTESGGVSDRVCGTAFGVKQ